MSLSKAMTNCNLSALQQVIYSFFASIPHDWYRNNNIAEYEGFYSSIVYSYFCALGYQVIAEDTTNSGKIDMTIIDKNKILVFEFKVIENCGSASALEQIKEKKYHEKYLSYGKPIYIVGVNFSSEKRNITEFRWEKFDSSGSGNRGLGFAVRGGKT